MSEAFLYHVWQYQYFDKSNLGTAQGDALVVIHPGVRNSHSGPDFSQAQLQFDQVLWVGQVEIHVYSSDWYDHGHHLDPAYDNVVLHVVWKDDKPARRCDGSLVPVIELKDRIDAKLLLSYKNLINQPLSIPCEQSLHRVHRITQVGMLDKVLMQRLEAKADLVLEQWRKLNGDWDELAYQLISKNFGFKVNAEPFERLAKAIAFRNILKHGDKLVQIEALLFGQAGFLDVYRFDDEYYQLLQREYHLLAAKYKLMETKLPVTQWRFLRLRPANFPTLRIAQLAMLIHLQKSLFDKLVDAETLGMLRPVLEVQPSPYWQRHYHFGKEVRGKAHALGRSGMDNLVMNTIVPLLVAYGKVKDDPRYADRAVSYLQELAVEDNVITRKWSQIGLRMESGFDSQAVLELHHEFCLKRRCIDCNIGTALIRPDTR